MSNSDAAFSSSTRAEPSVRGAAPQLARWPEALSRFHVAALEESSDTTERQELERITRALAEDALRVADLLDSRLELAAAGRAEARASGNSIPTGSLPSELAVSESRGRELSSSLRTTGARLSALVPVRTRRGRSVGATRNISTNRMRLSREYGPVATAWETYRRTVPVQSRTADLIDTLNERSIADSAALYERWVLVLVYTALIRRGFAPPPEEVSLLERIRVIHGELSVNPKKLAPLRLSKETRPGAIELTIHFDRQWPEFDNKTPDLVIDATHNHQEQRWVFDAKYRDYTLPSPDAVARQRWPGDHFRGDLEGVAEEKYRRLFQPQVSGILHCHLSRRYEHWDPEMTDPNRISASEIPHSLIALPLQPRVAEAFLVKLLRLLFGFHLGVVEVCWRCGGTGEPAGSKDSQGQPYRCPTCSAFWLASWCSACRRRGLYQPILKFFHGTGFHRTEPDEKNVHCPRCGDYFRPRDH